MKNKVIEYDRKINLKEMIKKNSFFLFGPRATGKTFWLKKSFPSNVPIFNLFDSDTYERFLRRPGQLKEELPKNCKYAVIDEIQRLPQLLYEVQNLITDRKINFLLTSSSARKLKRNEANLLAGRAWSASFFPLVSSEITDFNLLTYLNRGGLPRSYLSNYFLDELKAYAQLYLQEEIKAEGLSRKIDNFVRFLDVIALENGHELHYSNLSNESGVPIKSIENYIQVLKDTLIGFELLPFLATTKRKAITRSKFYFFDIGIANYLAKKGNIQTGSILFGEVFEHFIINEVRAYVSYSRTDWPLQYWRSQNGQEVDLIIGNKVAIEIKSSKQINLKHLKGLLALKEEKKVANYLIVSNDPIERDIGKITNIHWKLFLEKLWKGNIC